MNWIVTNRAWLFSGVLVAIPIAVLGWLLAKRQTSRVQKQKSGDNSANLQAGGNIDLRVSEQQNNVKAKPKRRR